MKLAPDQFERLAIEQLDAVYRMARRMTGDPTRAEDLVQETFLRAIRARDSFDLQQFGIRPWLMRILYNLHLTRGQRDGRQPVLLDDEALASAESVTTPDALPLAPGSFEGMDEQLVRAIETLPDDYRTPMMLWAVEDFSYKEIAETMDIPIGTVMSRLHRARHKLAEQLKEFAAERRIFGNKGLNNPV